MGWLGSLMAVRRKPTAQQPEPLSEAAGETPVVQPTEQIEHEPAPVAARSAVNRGKTGLGSLTADDTTPTSDTTSDTTSSRRHVLSSDVTVGVLIVVVISALTAWGVGTAVAASVASNDSRLVPVAIATTTPAPSSTGTTDRLAFLATIQNIGSNSSSNNSNWTVLTRSGKTLTIAVTDSTGFGTKRLAEPQGTFVVGDAVVIVAIRSNGVITAIRVAHAGRTSETSPIPTSTSTATT